MNQQLGGFRLPTAYTGSRPDQVPSWTGEDVAALARRVAAIEPVHVVDLRRRPHPSTAITMSVDLGIARRHRARCPLCRLRRVLYAIEVAGHAFGASEPRCAACWGIRGS